MADHELQPASYHPELDNPAIGPTHVPVSLPDTVSGYASITPSDDIQRGGKKSKRKKRKSKKKKKMKKRSGGCKGCGCRGKPKRGGKKSKSKSKRKSRKYSRKRR